MSPNRDDLARVRRRLEATRELLSKIQPRRNRRRARLARKERNETRRTRRRLWRDQRETWQDLEAAEELLELYEDDDEDEQTDAELALVAEIDLLEHELRRRRERIEAVRRRFRRRTRKWKRLDEYAERQAGRQRRLAGRKARLLKRIAEIKRAIANRPEWPADLDVSELLYHDPPHIHLASPQRERLIDIAKMAQEAGLRVGEFPPFDTVECVHVSGSWHYRDSGSPWTPRACSNRGNGLAMDLNHLTSGAAEIAFYYELERRYG